MGHDSRSDLQVLEQLGTQFAIDLGQEVEGDERGIAEVGFEEIAEDEFGFVGDAGRLGVLVGLLDALGVDVIPRAARRSEFLNGHDDDASVAAPEIVVDIAGVGVAELEHGFHDFGRGRHIRHVLLDFGLLGRKLGGCQEDAAESRENPRAAGVRGATPEIQVHGRECNTAICRGG